VLLKRASPALLLLAAGAGLALAAPPMKPEVEGRESNPVAREYYEPEKPRQEPGTGQTPFRHLKWDEEVAQESLVKLISMVMDGIGIKLAIR
jgi:hypothetical protein